MHGMAIHESLLHLVHFMRLDHEHLIFRDFLIFTDFLTGSGLNHLHCGKSVNIRGIPM